jgi:hypothetical protein
MNEEYEAENRESEGREKARDVHKLGGLFMNEDVVDMPQSHLPAVAEDEDRTCATPCGRQHWPLELLIRYG